MSQSPASYLLAGQPTELERLQLQSRVWEPAGRSLLGSLPSGTGMRVLDVGCGVLGWLRVLSEWVGPGGEVVGSDIDDKALRSAAQFVSDERMPNVTLARDDLFSSSLVPGSFDLVHARFQVAPLGRGADQVAAYRRLLRPGGWLVLEDPEMGSWRVNPEAAGVEELIALVGKAFQVAGGDFNAGRTLPDLLRQHGMEPTVSAQVVALAPGHPYLRLPLQFAASLRARIEAIVPPRTLQCLMERAERELARPGTWGTTFTLIQAVARL